MFLALREAESLVRALSLYCNVMVKTIKISDLLYKFAMISFNLNWHIKYVLRQWLSLRYSGYNFGGHGMMNETKRRKRRKKNIPTPIPVLN